jgi:adenosylcobinamide kinase / adenosylcobinamide-phosphate guanylyltransferase
MILMTGGSKSGKSSYALLKATDYKKRAFIATAEAFDDEMKDRIQKHQIERSLEYTTYEEPIEVISCLKKIGNMYDVIILDCVTVWIGNLLYRFDGDTEKINQYYDELLSISTEITSELIIVTNEVGMGIVPDNPLSRKFRDLAGMLNQKLAIIADEAYLLVSGIPMKIK